MWNTDLEDKDEYLAELIRRDNTISFIKQKLDETSEKLEKTAEELEAEKKLVQEKDKILQEKDKLILDLAKALKENNVPIVAIMEKTNLSKEQLDLL